MYFAYVKECEQIYWLLIFHWNALILLVWMFAWTSPYTELCMKTYPSSTFTILLTFPHDILSFLFLFLSSGSVSALIDPSLLSSLPISFFFLLSLREPDPSSLSGSSHLQLNGARFSTQGPSGLYSTHDLLEVISMILAGYIYDRHDT